MTANEKPRTHGAGNSNDIDGESTYANFRASHRLSQKSEYVFGKSAPLMTARDIIDLYYLHDHRWNKSKSMADQHLQAEGLIPVWSREDRIRADRFNRRVAIVDLYGGAA
jgi:hypothetical protein